jgi:hypothetical protein
MLTAAHCTTRGLWSGMLLYTPEGTRDERVEIQVEVRIVMCGLMV